MVGLVFELRKVHGGVLPPPSPQAGTREGGSRQGRSRRRVEYKTEFGVEAESARPPSFLNPNTNCADPPAGIGFKATAVASEVTYISSSGYTFAFDMRPDAYEVPCLGLVCPRWEEGLQEHMQRWLSQRVAGGHSMQSRQ